MEQHRRETSTGQGSVIYTHLQAKEHSFEIRNVHILDREDKCFIYVQLEKPSINTGGGLRHGHHLSSVYMLL